MSRVEINGRAYVVRGNVDTDTIIKSRHCVTSDAAALAPHCLAELDHAESFAATGPYPVIVCAGTFGIGSARIHAPMALAGAGVKAVLARAFAPIFYENCLNGAFLLPLAAPLEELPRTGDEVSVVVAGGELVYAWHGRQRRCPCPLPGWALEGRGWMQTIEEQAARAGGLEALRARGLEP